MSLMSELSEIETPSFGSDSNVSNDQVPTKPIGFAYMTEKSVLPMCELVLPPSKPTHNMGESGTFEAKPPSKPTRVVSEANTSESI